MLPELLQDLSSLKGSKFKSLWKDGFEDTQKCLSIIQDETTTIWKGPGNIVITNEPWYLSPYAIHRGLVDTGLLSGTSRLLRVCGECDVYYEKPGHGWVGKLKNRQPVPDVQDLTRLMKSLPGSWKKGGPAELVAICQSNDVVKGTAPETLAKTLVDLDTGASA